MDIKIEKYCNGCGEKIHYDAKFCKICGFQQIRIAEEIDSEDTESDFIEEVPIENAEDKFPIENTKSNYGLLSGVLGAIFICCIVGFLFYQNNKQSTIDKIVVPVDSVVIDTISNNSPTDTRASAAINNIDSTSNELRGNLDENSVKNDTENNGYQLIKDFFQVNVNGDYETLDEIFSARIDYHKLKDIPLQVVKSDIINFKRKWTIVSETLISIDLVQKSDKYDYYQYEKERLLKRNSDNGEIFKYKISGEMIIDNEIGKIVTIKDIKTIKIQD